MCHRFCPKISLSPKIVKRGLSDWPLAKKSSLEPEILSLLHTTFSALFRRLWPALSMLSLELWAEPFEPADQARWWRRDMAEAVK